MTDTAGYDLGSVGSPPPLYEQVEPKKKVAPTKASVDPVAKMFQTEDQIQQLEKQQSEDPQVKALREKQLADASKGVPPVNVEKWDAAKETAAHTTDPLQSFGSAASIFAVLASAFTHTPAINAMNGMAAGINAIHAGDEEAYKRAYEAWKENTDLALKRHDAMMEDYKVALEGDDVALKTATAKYQDPIIRMRAEMGDIQGIVQTLDARQRTSMEMRRTAQEIEINQPKAQASLELTSAAQAMQDAIKSKNPAKIQEAQQRVQTALQGVKQIEQVYSPTLSQLGKWDLYIDPSRKDADGNPTVFEMNLSTLEKRLPGTGEAYQPKGEIQPLKAAGAGGFGSGMKARFDQNMGRAGGEIVRIENMIGQQNIDTTGGIFEGANKGFQGYLAGRLQTENQGMFDAAFTGADVEIANLLKNGLHVDQGTAEEMVKGFKPIPSDTNALALYKLANMAAKTKVALENMFPADPDQKAKKEEILKEVSKFPAPEDVYRAAQSKKPITAKTYGEAFSQIKAQFGRPPGVPEEAQQALDGHWYTKDSQRSGKYLQWDK